MRKKRKLLLVAVPLVIIFSLIALLYLKLDSFASWLVLDDTPRPCELIIVHAGDGERFEYGKELFLEGMGKKLFLSFDVNYVKAVYGLEGLDLVENALRKLRSAGIPEDALVVVEGAESSYEEVLSVRKYREKNRFESAIVVSHPFHMRRLSMIYEKMFPRGEVSFLFCPTRGKGPEEVSTHEWWKREKELLWVNNEYVKIIFYRWKYL